MPNRSVAGYTQVPVAAEDILTVLHRRLNAAGTQTDVSVQYQFRDSLSAVRGTAQLTFQSGPYPASGASIIAACNAAQGT
jgi:hypothetical protein